MLGEKTPKTARGRRTLRGILDAAELEFGARGFHEASVASITTANAGAAQGTFCIYFDIKKTLFGTLVGGLGLRLRAYPHQTVNGAGTRIEVERRSLQSFIDFVREHGNLYRIVMECRFVDPEAFRAYLMDFAGGYQEGLERAVGDCGPRPEARRS